VTSVPSSGSAGLDLHLAEHPDALVSGLTSLVQVPPDDPFSPDVVLVPTRGVERWLTQRLAHELGAAAGDDGVCANIRFDSPAAATARVVAAVSGIAPADDPWTPGHLTWSVLDALDGSTDPELAPVRRHLGEPGDDVRQARRVRTAQRLARLLLDYDAQRPAMTTAWSAGEASDGVGAPLPADVAWQAALWRAVENRLALPSPSRRLAAAGDALEVNPHLVDLPQRLSVFGVSRLPLDQLRALTMLAAGRSVHLWLPVPSLALWQAAAALPAVAARGALPVVGRQRLLSSMAGDSVELAIQLTPGARSMSTEATPAAVTTSVLTALQHHVRTDAEATTWVSERDDRSIQVHDCHGAARQVEVLREVVVGLLAQDETLQPRDILVMCPDVERFAPLLSAVFGAVESDRPDAWVHPGRQLRVQVTDRAPGGANALLSFLSSLLELASGRVTATEVLDLLEQQPVRRRFELTADDLSTIRGWLQHAGVSWGADLASRTRYGVRFAQGTWRAGLDRLVLGVAMLDDGARSMPVHGRPSPGVPDVDALVAACEVPSTGIDLLGRFVEAVDRVLDAVGDLDGQQPVDRWISTLETALAQLTDVPADERWMQLEASRALSAVRDESSGANPHVSRHDIQSLLAPHLVGRPTRAGFRTGALTVCSLEPMRQVPHRAVILLGMDDQQFPRSRHLDGDDVLARTPLVGERDDHQDERRLFLDAVMSASEHLIVLYSGRHERSGAPMPPAVPVAELLDAVDDAVRLPGGPAAASLVIHHPLQPTDARNFVFGALGAPAAFSFDELDLAAARVAAQPRRGDGPFLARRLPPVEPILDIDSLVQALTTPVATFLSRRLRLILLSDVEQVADSLPVELDPVEMWGVGDRLLRATVSGIDPTVAVEVERARGKLPPGYLAADVLAATTEAYDPILVAARSVWRQSPQTLPVRVDLASRGTLLGAVEDVQGERIVTMSYSRLQARHRLAAWIRLLAATATTGTGMQAYTIGRSLRTSGAMVSHLTAPEPDIAVGLLDDLVALAGEALQAPLPLPVASAAEYAARRLAGNDVPDAMASAAALWQVPHSFPAQGEALEPAHEYVFGRGTPLRDVVTEPDPHGPGGEHTRFGALAVRVWFPLLQAEHLARHVTGTAGPS
jgi:exodeoxyribonuclease V gamma subunit